MVRKLRLVWLLAIAVTILSSCAVHTHKIGSGPAGADIVSKRQWYFFAALVQLNQIDTQAMASGATNYEIRTATTPVDFFLNIVTSFVFITSRTVTVTK